jgi:hypothetical protein
VGGVEAYPTFPHGCFVGYDGGNLAHADLQSGIAGREIFAPEGVDEVDDSERENNARTDNHENSCSHDGFILICAARRAPTHSQKARMNGEAGFGTLSAKDETKNNHKVKSGGQERPPHTTTTW